MIPRKSSNTSGSIVSERLRANWEVDPTMEEFFEDSTEMSWFSFEEILVDSETDIFDYDVEVSAGEVELIVVMNEMEMGVVAELSRDGKGSHG